MAPRLVDNETEGWGKAAAKKLLAEDILNGLVTTAMDWEDVVQLRPEYQNTSQRLFKTRLKRLLGQIGVAQNKATDEEAALLHDRALFPTPTHNYRGEPRWEGSEAQRLLRQDVANLVHSTMKPKAFHLTQAEYQLYPLEVFRGHIYQEVRFGKFCTWRNETGKKKATDWM
jgi:hypothetical protein